MCRCYGLKLILDTPNKRMRSFRCWDIESFPSKSLNGGIIVIVACRPIRTFFSFSECISNFTIRVNTVQILINI